MTNYLKLKTEAALSSAIDEVSHKEQMTFNDVRQVACAAVIFACEHGRLNLLNKLFHAVTNHTATGMKAFLGNVNNVFGKTIDDKKIVPFGWGASENDKDIKEFKWPSYGDKDDPRSIAHKEMKKEILKAGAEALMKIEWISKSERNATPQWIFAEVLKRSFIRAAKEGESIPAMIQAARILKVNITEQELLAAKNKVFADLEAARKKVSELEIKASEAAKEDTTKKEETSAPADDTQSKAA